ncbi:hypothetical protein ES288_A10G140100v1 [Gossypium darwinii]|uniref:DNA-directed RNA polymerase insert domain-containing protein n=1 Tax=Gossypium darwinii TaxID=34276 RepID=A0A5D2EZ49_GOSDA|nr:hypothetical protein ES288_A10G140100v1 [Gossypium darwinii]
MSTIPRLNQIQFEGFFWFMDRGLTEELYKFPKIEDREILMNLKEIVLRGNLYGTRNAFICAKGPGYVTAQDIILPPSVEIVDNTQHVASLTEPIDLCIGLQIERNRGYGIKTPKNFHDGSYLIDAVFMPVRNANHSIHCYGNDNEK